MTLRESNHWIERFNETADLLPGIICEVNTHLQITYINELAYRSFKYTLDDIKAGISMRDLMPPDEFARSSKNVAKVFSGQKIGPQEYRLVHKDGEIREYQVNSSPMFKDDQVVGLRACIFDISDRKKAERELQKSEERFRQIFSKSPIGICLFDGNGKLIEINDSFRTMFSSSLDKPLHASVPGLFDLVEFTDEMRGELKKGAVITQESTFNRDPSNRDVRLLDWRITRLGTKDGDPRRILAQVQDITEQRQAENARLDKAHAATAAAQMMVEKLRKEVSDSFSFSNMISRNTRMREIFDIIPQMAEATTTVLISGESGTGKELIAKALHKMSPRKSKPFVAINCSALPDNLLESELFGYKKGAFTDAKQDKPGKFELADGGVIFLDEIGDISPTMQAKLLRVLQEREVEPLGGCAPKKVNVRVLTATNRDLAAMASSGEFREDLFYRLNVLKLKLPPLRERRTDIPILCDHFIGVFNEQFSKSISGISQAALNTLLSHDFPGNIRELENIIEHAFVFCKEDTIQIGHLPEEFRQEDTDLDNQVFNRIGSLEELEAEYLKAVIKETGGNKLEAAKKLKIHKSTLFRKLKKLGIH